MFTITTELSFEAIIPKEVDNHLHVNQNECINTSVKQFLIPLDDEAKLEWFKFVKVNEYIVPNFNEDVIIAYFKNTNVNCKGFI